MGDPPQPLPGGSELSEEALSISIIKNNLTIRGQGNGSNPTTIKPIFSGLIDTTRLFSSDPQKAIILMDRTSGGEAGEPDCRRQRGGSRVLGCSPGFFGIFYRGTSGAIEGVTATGVKLPPTLLMLSRAGEK